jgi:hypothetical protein
MRVAGRFKGTCENRGVPAGDATEDGARHEPVSFACNPLQCRNVMLHETG